MKVKSLSRVQLFETPWTTAHQAPLSVGFSRQECWSGVPLPSTLISVQFSSVIQSCLTLCDPMNRSTPGLPVHHHLLEFTQTHVHRVGDAISHLIIGRPLLLLPSIPPSIRVFSNDSTLHMGGQSTGVSALASFLPKKSQG